MNMRSVLCCAGVAFGVAGASAVIVTDPNDARSWQGANVGTFAQLYYGSDTPATRQQVVDNQLLDDELFDDNGFLPASLVNNTWSATYPNSSVGRSLDMTGTGSYDYVIGDSGNVFDHANAVDDLWFQSSGTVGDTVFDMGFYAQYAAVFAVIDHGPLPQESIESTVYLSNGVNGPWTQAEVKRVYLEGYMPNTGILWDGFCYVVEPQGGGTFRYASIIHGGPGGLISDGDDEINAIMGLPGIPAPGAALVLASGLFIGGRRRR